MKLKLKRKDVPSRNPMAQVLRHGLFRAKQVRSKKDYTRKGRFKGDQRYARSSLQFESQTSCDSIEDLSHSAIRGPCSGVLEMEIVMLQIERNLKVVLGVDTFEQVRKCLARLTAVERKAVEEFYGFDRKRLLDTQVALRDGVKVSAVACRRLRALRKLGAITVVHIRGEARSGLFLGGNTTN